MGLPVSATTRFPKSFLISSSITSLCGPTQKRNAFASSRWKGTLRSMIELLQFTGPRGFLLLLIGGLGAASSLGALALAGTSRFQSALLLAGVTLGLGCSAMLLGAIGKTKDMQSTYRAVAYASPADRETILQGSRHEAQANVTLGTYVFLPLVLLALGAIGLSFARTGETS